MQLALFLFFYSTQGFATYPHGYIARVLWLLQSLPGVSLHDFSRHPQRMSASAASNLYNTDVNTLLHTPSRTCIHPGEWSLVLGHELGRFTEWPPQFTLPQAGHRISRLLTTSPALAVNFHAMFPLSSWVRYVTSIILIAFAWLLWSLRISSVNWPCISFAHSLLGILLSCSSL